MSTASRSRADRDRARPPTSLPTRTAVFTVDDTVECISVEGRAAVLDDGERREKWIARYVAKYAPITPELSADFLRANLVVELVPERAFGIIEREEEFSARATKWTFDDPNAADG